MDKDNSELIKELKNMAAELRAMAKARHDLFAYEQEADNEFIENLLEWQAALLVERVINKIGIQAEQNQTEKKQS